MANKKGRPRGLPSSFINIDAMSVIYFTFLANSSMRSIPPVMFFMEVA